MTEDRTSVPMDDNMSLDQAVPSKSKYLSKEDCEPPLLVQIHYMSMDEVEGDNNVIEHRAVLHFHGDVKPLILNNTNKELLKAITGATTIGQLRNQTVTLYNDPTIMFGRKMVGGIRIRAAGAPAPQGLPQTAPPPAPAAPEQGPAPNPPMANDEIPYP